MPAPILERLTRAENLPSLPAVALEVVNLTRSEDSTIQQIANCIQHDPALSAKILKMVNSSYFGLAQKVGSVQRAVALLGMRTVKVLALSFSIVDVMQGGDDQGFSYGDYWRHSLTCAVAARLLATMAAPSTKEEAFIGGLLCDIGMMATHKCDPSIYPPVFEEWSRRGRRDVEVEAQLLGFTHAALSKGLLSAWSLPPGLCDAIGAHHGEGFDQVEEGSRKLAAILRAASLVMGVFCKDIPSTELDAVKQECQKLTGASADWIEKVFETVHDGVQEMAEMLSLSIGETASYAQIQTDAAMQIARISMETQREIHEVKQSVALAGERQRKLMPTKPPSVPGCEFGLVYSPLEHVSGDFYDFVKLPGGKVGILIGDVSGHGIEAGVVMGVAKKTLSLRLGEKSDPIYSLGMTNRDLHTELDGNTFVSAFVAAYDPADKVLLFGRAGHNPPILFNPNRRPADLVQLASAGMVLGRDQGARFEAAIVRGRVRAQPGDVFLFYTDGVTEMMNPASEEFGIERLCEAVRNASSLPPDEMLDQICLQLEAFREDRPQEDDVTMLVMKIVGA